MHELRNALTAAMSWVHLLREGKLGTDMTGRAIESIERSLNAQQRIINDLLDTSRLQRGEFQLECRATELKPLVRSTLSSLEAMAEVKSVRLRAQLGRGSCVVMADPDRIQQILLNLVSNAIKFTPSNGNIQVRLSRVETEAELTISDSGNGFGLEFLPYVFEKFAQEKAGEHEGLGLGLAIVRALVQLHGGSIRAENTTENGGARISVRLPLLRQASSAITFRRKM